MSAGDASSPHESHGASALLCTFSLDARRFGIAAADVEEVIRATAPVPVALAPPTIAGLINLRGRIVTVIDLRRLFGLAPGTRAARTVLIVRGSDAAYGLLADAVGDVLRLSDGVPAPVPGNTEPRMARYARRVWTDASGLVLELGAQALTATQSLVTESGAP